MQNYHHTFVKTAKEEKINSYLLKPQNFFYSSQEPSVAEISEQDVLVTRFIDFINGLQRPFSLEMIKDYDDLMFHKSMRRCVFDRVILNTAEDAAAMLDSSDIRYESTPTRRREIRDESPGHVILKDGLYCKTYALTAMPSEIQSGWFYHMYSMSDALRLHVCPIPDDKRKSVINNHKSSELSAASTSDLADADDIMAMRELVLKRSDNEGLFLIKISVSILSDSLDGLQKRQRSFEQKTRSRFSLHTSSHVQKSLLDGTIGYPFLVIRSTFAALIPFHTSELDEDGGFLIGVNNKTGHPFQWNPQNRMNKNTVLVAPSGSGKTTTAMMIIHCFEKTYPESLLFGLSQRITQKVWQDFSLYFLTKLYDLLI